MLKIKRQLWESTTMTRKKRKKKICERGRQNPNTAESISVGRRSSPREELRPSCAARHTAQIQSTEHERTTAVANLPTIQRASCLSVSPQQPQCYLTGLADTSHVLQCDNIHQTHQKTCYSGLCERGGNIEGDARCTLVLRCLQEMFRCFVQGRRVQLSLIMSRPRNSHRGYYEKNHNT